MACALHLDLANALIQNPVGPLWTVVLVTGVFWFGSMFMFGSGRSSSWATEVRFVTRADYALTIALVVVWLCRMFRSTV